MSKLQIMAAVLWIVAFLLLAFAAFANMMVVLTR